MARKRKPPTPPHTDPRHPDYVGPVMLCQCGRRVREYHDGVTDVASGELHTCLSAAACKAAGRGYISNGLLMQGTGKYPSPLMRAPGEGEQVTVTLADHAATVRVVSFVRTMGGVLRLTLSWPFGPTVEAKPPLARLLDSAMVTREPVEIEGVGRFTVDAQGTGWLEGYVQVEYTLVQAPEATA